MAPTYVSATQLWLPCGRMPLHHPSLLGLSSPPCSRILLLFLTGKTVMLGSLNFEVELITVVLARLNITTVDVIIDFLSRLHNYR